jgi:hypothetical protein
MQILRHCPQTDGFFKYLCWITGTIFLLGTPWLMYTYHVACLNLDYRKQYVLEIDNQELSQLKVNNLYLSQELNKVKAELEQVKNKKCKCSDKCTCGPQVK